MSRGGSVGRQGVTLRRPGQVLGVARPGVRDLDAGLCPARPGRAGLSAERWRAGSPGMLGRWARRV